VVLSGFFWTVYKLFGSDVVVQDGQDPDVSLYPHYNSATVPKQPPSTANSEQVVENYNTKSRFSGSPTSPAPAYRTHPDINTAAPFTLNPHPFPSSSNDDVFGTENTTPKKTSIWKKGNRNNPFDDNEKNGFI